MQVDPRRDHSLRIPRPELTAEIGTPNACAACHDDQTPEWAVAAVENWYGPRTPTPQASFARAIAAADRSEPGSQVGLLKLAKDADLPSIYRASAMERVTPLDRQSLDAVLDLAHDPDPLVRLHAIRASSNAMQMESVETYVTALTDPIRSVRFEAARALASYPREAIPKANLDTLDSVLKNYETALAAHADMPGNRFNLGILHASQGRQDDAVTDYRAALTMDPFLLPVRFNLAGMLNALGRNSDAEQVLRDGLERHPDEGELYYSLGLLLAEDQRWADAATALGQAARRIQHRPRVWYNYALALQQAGDLAGAETAYRQGLRATPDDADLLYAAAVFYLQQGRVEEAQTYAEPLVQQHPQDPQIQALVKTIRRQLNAR
jgi:tetratricopeptide (TPR) repeat protein